MLNEEGHAVIIYFYIFDLVGSMSHHLRAHGLYDILLVQQATLVSILVSDDISMLR
jgi:hypothetical protein